MKKLFSAADRYLEESDWRTMALLKFCLCAMGVLIGIALPKKAKKPALFIALAVFLATYLPLMLKFLPFLRDELEED